jgi:hypothetical protein
MPSAAPIRPASLVSTQQGVETSLLNDLTPFRKAYIFTTLRFVKTYAYGYRGLKIFTPLTLRFHDFQRLKHHQCRKRLYRMYSAGKLRTAEIRASANLDESYVGSPTNSQL